MGGSGGAKPQLDVGGSEGAKPPQLDGGIWGGFAPPARFIVVFLLLGTLMILGTLTGRCDNIDVSFSRFCLTTGGIVLLRFVTVQCSRYGRNKQIRNGDSQFRLSVFGQALASPKPKN